ncbi:MAG TPA: PTS sugar transporter subunit IIA [Opitutaceae bacterium]|nr:PTS sugar transporter subunit IIA [Opitutaceae bacterium]
MYLNLIQIAESFGVSETVVEDWIRNEGLPHTPDRGRLLFDKVQVANWAAARGLAAKTGFLAMETPALANTWRLEPLLRAGGIWRDVAASEVPAVFERVVGTLPGATPPIRQFLIQRLRSKDGINLAPVGGGFALPHPSSRVALGRESGSLALLILRDALMSASETPDGEPVSRLLFFIAPSPRAHLDILGRLCRTLNRGPLRDQVARGAADQELYAALAAADASVTGAAGGEVAT